MSRKPDDIPLKVWIRRRRMQSGGILDPLKPVVFEDGKRFYSFLPLECENCGRERWLKTSDYRKSVADGRHCRSCVSHDKGKKGYAAMRRRYSHDEWLELIRKAQIAKPSSSEIKAREILNEVLPAGYVALEQVIDDGRILDFVIVKHNDTSDPDKQSWVAIIEINGYWHRRNEKQAMRDRSLKLSSLIPVEFIDDRQLWTGDGQEMFANLVYDHIVKFKESVCPT